MKKVCVKMFQIIGWIFRSILSLTASAFSLSGQCLNRNFGNRFNKHSMQRIVRF